MADKRHYSFVDQGFLRRLERLSVMAKQHAARLAPALARSRRLGDGLEFADHRDYSPGDDMRFIDWPYFARMEKLLLRLFHEHSEAGVTILVDRSASMADGDGKKFSYARRAAAAMAYIAMAGLERVTLLPFWEQAGEVCRAGRDRGHIFGVLDCLEALSPAGRTDALASAREVERRHPLQGTVILISDLLDADETLPKALAILASGGAQVVVLHVISPADAEPKVLGPLLLQHAELGERLAVTVDSRVIESYRHEWQAFTERCRRACIARQAVYVPAATDKPFERLALMTLRRAGVVAG